MKITPTPYMVVEEGDPWTELGCQPGDAVALEDAYLPTLAQEMGADEYLIPVDQMDQVLSSARRSVVLHSRYGCVKCDHVWWTEDEPYRLRFGMPPA